MTPNTSCSNPKEMIAEMFKDKWSLVEVLDYFEMLGFSREETLDEWNRNIPPCQLTLP